MASKTRRFSEEEAKLIRKEYDNGATLVELAEKYRVSAMTISRTMARGGVTTRGRSRPTRFDEKEAQQLRKEYEGGATPRYLATVYGGHPTTILIAIQKAGGTLRPPGSGRKRNQRGLLGWVNS